MRSSGEQLQEIMKRADGVQEKRVIRKRMCASAGAAGVFALFLIAVFVYLPNLSVASREQDAMLQYGSLLLSVPYMGYALVGFLSFVMGICFMLFCVYRKELNLKEK